MTRPKSCHVTHKAPYTQAHDLTDAGFAMLKALWANPRVMRKHINEAAFPMRKGQALVLGKFRIARIADAAGWGNRPAVGSYSSPAIVALSEKTVAATLASAPAVTSARTGNTASEPVPVMPPPGVEPPSDAAVSARRWELTVGCGLSPDDAARQIQREVTRFGDAVGAFWAGNHDPAAAKGKASASLDCRVVKHYSEG